MTRRAPRKRERGGAILFVVALIAALTTIWIAAANVSAAGLRYQVARENSAVMQAVTNGAADYVRADMMQRAVPSQTAQPFGKPLGTANSLMVGDVAATVTLTDNSANLAKTLTMTVNAKLGGRTYQTTRVIGAPFTPHPIYYAFSVNRDFSTNGTVQLGSTGSNGDLYTSGKLQLSSPANDIEGDVETNGSATCMGTVTGNVIPNSPIVPWPTFTRSNYLSAALGIPANSPTYTNYTFASVLGVYYPICYCSGDLKIKGSLLGNGTFYVTGNLLIQGNLTYASTGSHVMFIVEGDVNVGAGVTQICGYFYAQGRFNPGPGTVSVSRGSMAASDVGGLKSVSINYDPFIFNDPTQANRLRVPGFWP